MPYIDSYYKRSSQVKFSANEIGGDLITDVCVIGGGLAGVSTALGLVQRGSQCMLVEAEKIGWGASGRNGGFVASGFSESPLMLARKLGESKAKHLHSLTQQAYALVESRLAQSDKVIAHPQKGTITASWFNETDVTKRNIEEINRIYDEQLEFWPREKMAQSYLTERYFGGYLKPETMSFHSLDYNLHTANLAQAAGAKLYEDCPATKVQRVGNHWLVHTPTAVIRAEQVVYACSGYIDSLNLKLSISTLPVATYVLLTEPLGSHLEHAVRAPYGVVDNRFASNYYRVVGDQQILWGGRVSMFHPNQRRLKEIMLADLLSVYPQLKGITGEVAWGGYMGYARHKMPQLGRLKSGLWYCQGFGGHGMVTTTMGGELIAAAINSEDKNYQLFSTFGLDYVGKPFGPVISQVAYWAYQMQDALKAARLNHR